MAANPIDLTYDEIQNHIGQSVMWDRNPGAWTTSHTNDFNLALKRGVRRVYFEAALPGESQPHTWSFMRPKGTLTLHAPYSESTIDDEIDRIVLFRPSGSDPLPEWPSWAADGELHFTDAAGDFFRTPVRNRISDSEISLEGQTVGSVNLFGSTTYELIPPYNLPDDYAGIASSGFTLRRDQKVLGQIPIVNEQEIRRYDNDDITGPPEMAAIIPEVATATDPTRWRAIFYPSPDDDYELDYRYTAVPPNVTPSAGFHWGGAPISELMLASILDYAWQYVRDSNEKHDDYLKCLETAVKQDRKRYPVHTHGQGSNSPGAGTRGYQDFLDYQREKIPYSNITTNW